MMWSIGAKELKARQNALAAASLPVDQQHPNQNTDIPLSTKGVEIPLSNNDTRRRALTELAANTKRKSSLRAE